MSESATMIASFSGEIDFTTRDRFRAQLAEIEAAETAIVDLSEVAYMDSSALAELLFLNRSRTRRGLSAPRVIIGPRLHRLYEAAGMENVMTAFTSLDEARKG